MHAPIKTGTSSVCVGWDAQGQAGTVEYTYSFVDLDCRHLLEWRLVFGRVCSKRSTTRSDSYSDPSNQALPINDMGWRSG